MLGLPAYRLEKRQTQAAILFELFDRETGRLVAVARHDTVPQEKPGRLATFQRKLFDSPWFRWLVIPFVLVIIALGMIAAVLGLISPPRRERPRLVLRRVDTDEAVFELVQSLGMFYDARNVYDGRGHAVARFRGHSKMSLGPLGFGIIDLGGSNEDLKDDSGLPWLGRLAAPVDGVYGFFLVGGPEGGRVIEPSWNRYPEFRHLLPRSAITRSRPAPNCGTNPKRCSCCPHRHWPSPGDLRPDDRAGS